MKIVKLISVADLFTIVNALLGFTSIICLLKGKIDFAIVFILFAILADGADGFVARRFSKKWCLGDYLDIMADTISFCVAPAILIFTLYYDSFRVFVNSATESLSDGILLWNLMSQSLVILSCLIFVASGVLRLARFCYLPESKSFVGLPAPGAALVILLFSALKIHPVIITVFTIILSFLMISDIKYPKTRGKIAYISGGIILITTASMFFSFHPEIILPGALIFAISYAFFSPLSMGKNR
ncbi:MAG: CDP-alcohol phosphatidyltransferase family protein [Thermoplasmatales archaeon]|nr:CDP-alcohol phosphatidyltransferase family protein [Candidatus Thermoplasmatota archaeon]MCG2826593.1 CDP-alcohol phosphatidyltransferase family protein [Thermoplasmatales archaeon]